MNATNPSDVFAPGAPVIRRIHVDELVDKEARHIVEMMIEDHLNKLDLPMPKESSLAIHVDHVLKHRPDIVDKARERVELGQDAYTESMKTIGVTIEVLKPIVIDIGGDAI